MSATILEILEKVIPAELYPSLPQNFVFREGESVPAHIIVENPNVSLYCLDDANRRALFVETPLGIDLEQAPFYYMAQYDHAQRLIAVPYETFHHLADEIISGDLIIIHSTGRCGSTLISQAFAEVDGVRSLSEPDIFTQIHFMRFLDRSRDDEYRRLLRSCTRLYSLRAPTLALKFRAMCIQVGDLLYEAFPDAKNLFLYRNAETWARSMGVEFRPLEDRRQPVAEFPIYRRSMAPLSLDFAARRGREANPVELAALAWLSLVERYVALYDSGIPFLAVRFEDIRAQPRRVLAAIFDYCGLRGASVERAYAVFARDSQEGTVYSQASRQEQPRIPLTEDERARFQEILAERPVVRSADYIAPGTLMLGEA